MKTAMTDLKLKQLYVVHAGEASFPLSGRVQAVALADLLKIVGGMR